MNKTSYVIRIYDVGHDEPPYVPYGEDADDCLLIVTEIVKDLKGLMKRFHRLIKSYEGWAYTVYSMEMNTCIVGGAFDPYDEDIIKYNLKG